MDIAVSGIRMINKGSLKALVDVSFGDMIVIRDFRIVQQSGRGPWVSLPVRMWTSEGGERFHSPLVELGNGLKQEVIEQILNTWDKFVKEQSGEGNNDDRGLTTR